LCLRGSIYNYIINRKLLLLALTKGLCGLSFFYRVFDEFVVLLVLLVLVGQFLGELHILPHYSRHFLIFLVIKINFNVVGVDNVIVVTIKTFVLF
jgi:hypothetical protein